MFNRRPNSEQGSVVRVAPCDEKDNTPLDKKPSVHERADDSAIIEYTYVEFADMVDKILFFFFTILTFLLALPFFVNLKARADAQI